MGASYTGRIVAGAVIQFFLEQSVEFAAWWEREGDDRQRQMQHDLGHKVDLAIEESE